MLFSNLVSNIWDMWSVQQDFPLIRPRYRPYGIGGYRVQSQMFTVSWVLPGTIDDFIPQFARIAAPLTNLTRKDHPFAWTLREGEAF